MNELDPQYLLHDRRKVYEVSILDCKIAVSVQILQSDSALTKNKNYLIFPFTNQNNYLCASTAS